MTAASAITDSSFKYSTVKTGLYTISPMAMSPDRGNPTVTTWFTDWDNGLTGAGCFNTGINLPAGAKITNLRVIARSNGGATTVTALVAETNLTSGSASPINSFTATIPNDNTVAARNLVVSPPVTVDGNHAYGVGICITANQRFLGARVTYTYQNAGA